MSELRSAADAARVLVANGLDSDAETWRRVGDGIEFDVYRTKLDGLGDVAIRFSPRRWIANDNDRELDSRELQRQEKRFHAFSLEHGLPAPRVHGLFESERGPDVLVLEWIESDGSEPGAEDVGRLAASLHRLPLPVRSSVAQRRMAAADVVSTLTAQRAEVVQRLAGPIRVFPSRADLRDALLMLAGDVRFLHMDIRAANLPCVSGRIRALLDWSNALVGPRLLELARLREYGFPMEELRNGYGEGSLWDALETRAGLACSLYTAVMLAVVFLSEAPDPAAAERAVERVHRLCDDYAARSRVE